MMKKENIPNLLTVVRILMIPLFIVLTSVTTSTTWHIVAAIVFAIASLTDYLDGYLARKWQVVTNFGKFADPLADKMLVMSAFIMLVGLDLAPAWDSTCCSYARENKDGYSNVCSYFFVSTLDDTW